LRVDIQNFGPIENASIETKSLTLIIGKNNQGKSYTVELLFSLLQFKRFISSPGLSVGAQKGALDITASARTQRVPGLAHERPTFRSIRIERSDFDRYSDKDLARQIVDKSISIIKFFADNYLPSFLEERFGMKVEALVNINASSSNIRVDFSKYLSLLVSISTKGEVAVEDIRKEKELIKLEVELVPFVTKIRSEFPVLVEDRGNYFPKSIFEMFRFLFGKLSGQEERPFGDIVYIPAGRAGLLEGYYSVASALFYLSPVAPIRGISMPAMPPAASIFYNLLFDFLGGKGEMSKISSELAKDVLEGDFVLERNSKQRGLAKIRYRFSKGPKKGTVDVIHAGSMVKELAGLYLAIREKIKRGTHLIMEEPESHLHPSAQKKLARILMKLAANGVETTITTHSDIILREVAHLVGQLKRTKSKDILPASKVSVVFLKEGKTGSSSEELKIPPSGILEGIPTFDEVITELYEEEIKLEAQSSEEE